MARRRVIDELRRLFPDQTWRYDAQMYHWECAAGEVSGVSCLAPRYDGDDDTFASELWFYSAEGKATRIAWKWPGSRVWVFDTFRIKEVACA